MDLRSLAWWDCGFESHQGQDCLSLGTVVCCPTEVSASCRPFFQSSLTQCGASECDDEASMMRRPWSTVGCWAMKIMMID